MKNLQQIKNLIFTSQCANLITDSMCFSEPLPRMSQQGIIDCYFLYSMKYGENAFYTPEGYFGIYSESGQMAFWQKREETEWKEMENSFILVQQVDSEKKKAAYWEYVRLFPFIRDYLYQTDCNDEQRKMIKAYMNAFSVYVGTEMIPFYQKLVPEFFAWILEQTL